MSAQERDIKYIKGIGEKRAQLFKKRLGLFTLNDLLEFYPRKYEDWTAPLLLCDIPLNETICIKAKISTDIEEKKSYKTNIVTYTFYIYDRTGQVKVVLFNNKYLAESLKKDETYLFYGKVKWNGIYREMDSPEIRPEFETKLRPIYRSTTGLTSRQIEKIIPNALELAENDDILPENIIKKYNLISHYNALKEIHLPTSKASLNQAVRRLSFEELLLLRLGYSMIKKRNRGKSAKAIHPASADEINGLFDFSLTTAQKRVINECLKDMNSNIPMNRLIQGDVGSGKTAVAAALMLCVKLSGYMSVMLVPTEILAEQHFSTLSYFFRNFNVNIGILTGSLNAKEKKEIKKLVKAKKIDILIATHAVLTEDVELPNTALVVTDEQHRFGVSQRALLSKKADYPHTLVMSATPIPRTLGLIIYGDLDISIIDELPKGRIPIKSYFIGEEKRERALNYVKKHIDNGYQGYIVCPVISDMLDEEKEKSELKAATEYSQELKNKLFKGYSVGLLHGKMKQKEKEEIMNNFAAGNIKLLVSTTVIEVGIDVPNAVIMIIEDADRFGLAQLHQLRGRVGRGNIPSTCIFISSNKSKSVAERMRIMCATTDGFKIAEADLKQRGPGNFLGKEQHGLPKLKIADLLDNSLLLNDAISAADFILNDDVELSKPENSKLKNAVNSMFIQSEKIEFN